MYNFPRQLRVAIVGSRDYPNLEDVDSVLKTLHPSVIVISGGARGVDRRAALLWRDTWFRSFIEKKPDYVRFGSKRAPYERDKIIAAMCDSMVAFWDGLSDGTIHVVNYARAMGKNVRVIRPPEKP